MSRLTKAQVFAGDAVLAILVFMVIVILYFTVASHIVSPESRTIDALSLEADSIASSLALAGVPENWTEDSVVSIGLSDGSHRLSQEKVFKFINLSRNLTSSLFGTGVNYAVFFRDADGNILFFGKCVVTNSGIFVENISPNICSNFTVENATGLVSSGRLLAYNSEFVQLTVYAWNG
jgi:hypothetical protein